LSPKLDVSEALGHMTHALGLEVAAIRKKGGGNRVELRGGERVGQSEGSWLYKFPVAEDLNLRDDTPVRVACGQDEVNGVLVSYREGIRTWGPRSPWPVSPPMTPFWWSASRQGWRR
jgi:hypothetical protein